MCSYCVSINGEKIFRFTKISLYATLCVSVSFAVLLCVNFWFTFIFQSNRLNVEENEIYDFEVPYEFTFFYSLDNRP